MQKQIKNILGLVVFAVILIVGSGQAFASYEISDGSVKALYHLEDTVDSSGNGKNLTNNNSSTFVSSKFYNGVSLDGVNQNLSKSDSYFNLTNISVCFWFKPDVVGNDHVIVSKMTNVDTGFYVVTRSDNTMWFGFGNTGATNVASVGNYDNSSWQFFCGTYDGTNIRAYLNATKGTDASGSYTMNTTASFRIGAAETGIYYDGKVDELMVLNRALSQSEITAIYNANSEICTTAGCGGTGTGSSTSSSTGCLLQPDSVDSDFITNYFLKYWFYGLLALILFTIPLRWIFKKVKIK